MLFNRTKIDQYNKEIESLYEIMLKKLEGRKELEDKAPEDVKQLAGKITKYLVYSFSRQTNSQSPQEWMKNREIRISANAAKKDFDVIVL